jgi:4-amino-4-deoxy-L-arabinose transferase-like glycosyltransferase
VTRSYLWRIKLQLAKVRNGKNEYVFLTKSSIRNLLSDNYPLLSILIGIGLVSVSIGPFQNGDTQWEYEAASGVIRWGMPYVGSFGNMINQPPLGFYIEALFFKVFGLSFDVGVALVTLFGLGCIVLVYKIGKVLYGKSKGLLAAALFALTPWEIVLSRTFLIDVQCLFFSLFCLFVGISAIHKNSFKLSMISGTFFAAALLTKLFAVFTLIPLFLFYVYYRPKNLRRTFSLLVAFVLPVLLFAFLWYQVILGKGLFSVFHHADFVKYNFSDVVPSYFFVGNFLFNYGLGWFFMSATVFSLLVCFLRRKIFSKFLVFDLICLITIVSVVSVNTFLGASLNLEAPYFNAVKYDYQSLPFFSLLAATLPSKCLLLFNSAKSKRKLNKLLLFSIALVGLFLLAASIFVNIVFVNFFSRWNYLLFRVEMDKNVGYSLFNPTPTDKYGLLMNLQYLGFAFVLSGLVWASRHKIAEALKSIRRWIERKSNKPLIKTQIDPL